MKNVRIEIQIKHSILEQYPNNWYLMLLIF